MATTNKFVEEAKMKTVISPPSWYMARRTWKFRYWSHGMGIRTLSGPNDPFCGHLWVECLFVA